MPGQDDRLIYLLDQFRTNRISETELGELLTLMETGESETLVGDKWMNELETADLKTYDKAYWSLFFHQMMKKIRPVAKVRVLKLWTRIAVAASIILLVGAGIWIFIPNKTGTQKPKSEVAVEVKPPQTNRATITLADGETVFLDSAGNGQLAMQGNIKLVKLADGQIAYQTEGGGASTKLSMTYNTVSNPRGSRVIDMMLSDGSHVWLNSGSSVKFPIAFVGKERIVEITGEAYFEVKHDAAKPFIVSVNDMQVEVLGTHFNINSYADEGVMKTTLLEGSVRVKSEAPSTSLRAGSSRKSEKTIKPGEQAILSFPSAGSGQAISVVSGVDLDVVMAWKNGLFEFGGQNIEAVMKEISRWYDVDVVYEQKPVANFRGTISRQENIAEVLKMLELTGAVKFRVEGKKLVVTK